MRISDWSSDVCSSDLFYLTTDAWESAQELERNLYLWKKDDNTVGPWLNSYRVISVANTVLDELKDIGRTKANSESWDNVQGSALRSEEHTSELQSLMRILYAVFDLKQKN